MFVVVNMPQLAGSVHACLLHENLVHLLQKQRCEEIPDAAGWSHHVLPHHALQQACLSRPVRAACPWDT